MNRILEVSCLLLCCSLAGCSRSDNADIAKARAKPEAAKKGGPKKPGLDGAGSVTFPDGKKRPLAELWYSEPLRGTTIYGPVGGGNSPGFKLEEMVLVSDGSGYNVKEKAIMRDELCRMSFGPTKEKLFVPSGKVEYCDLELESTDGKRETFPCVLRNLTLIVRYADGIGIDKLQNSQLGGITFRAGE